MWTFAKENPSFFAVIVVVAILAILALADVIAAVMMSNG